VRRAPAFDAIVDALTTAGTMTSAQVQDLITVALALTASLWQISHPRPPSPSFTLSTPLGHVAIDFEPRLTRLLRPPP
jgi:Tetracyclin repressor-like, C-terminal domain